MAEATALVGVALELEVGAPAHGGSCVARHDGRVVFVRHALPGERVRAVVTEDRGSYLRADAVDILDPADGRVAPPCPHSGPGRCGGCDWQHVSGELQRAMKAEVVREQFLRLAGLDVSDLLTKVEALADDLLGWRTRITYATDPTGRLGLHRYRSSEIELIDHCPLGVDGVGNSEVLARVWPGLTGVEVVRAGTGEPTVLAHRPGRGRQARGRRPPDRVEVLDGPGEIAVSAAGRPMSLTPGTFWQVHPGAADTYAAAVLEAVRPAAGETVLELYSGAGALTAVLADAVGPTGGVLALESSRAAVADARRNLADVPWVRTEQARIDAAHLAAISDQPDLVVLDPPRTGLGAEATRRLLDLGPRAVAYVACDPASLARDTRAALDAGWRLAGLRAFDAFPMTHHVECLAHLVPVEP
ncbi:MAG: hypothetical protein QOG80_320 [Pseudonocardiales bacterium]|jgi:tRNA/tmRNA/rRNA uracil-C5-methylase (TrmA/RlmC/RlmD family)|nr:hypothetical protein [Pseudonocardiales bacterium]